MVQGGRRRCRSERRRLSKLNLKRSPSAGSFAYQVGPFHFHDMHLPKAQVNLQILRSSNPG